MDNAVDGGHRHQGVWKDLIPVTKGLIRGDDQAAAFIPMSNKFKQDNIASKAEAYSQENPVTF